VPAVKVLGGSDDIQGRFAHSLAEPFVHDRRRAFFNNLLMASLDGAFALSKKHGVTMSIRENLNLNVPGMLDKLFEVDRIVTECGLRFCACH
jgi:hypothetical protein